jgi:thiol-disulfide isomerase/thioredoxin
MRRNCLNTLLLIICLLLLPSALPAAQEGGRLIPFKGNDLSGQPFDLQQSIGSKSVVLIFWASWCPTCITEVPKINQLAEKFRSRGMDFIAVNVGFNDSVERAQAFIKKTGMAYPAFFDSTGTVTEQYMLQGVPTIIIADKKGIIRFRNFTAPEITEANFAQLMAD